MKKKINYFGFEYVEIHYSGKGLHARDLQVIEADLAKEIIESRPIRGLELKFLRKQLGVSAAKLSGMLDNSINPSTITRWESREKERLSAPNEMLIRVFFAGEHNVKIAGSMNDLVPKEIDKAIVLKPKAA